MRGIANICAIAVFCAFGAASAFVVSCAGSAGVRSTSKFTDIPADRIAEALSPGWNLGNQLEGVTLVSDASSGEVVTVPGETAYMATKVSKELILAVKKAGFRSVRVPVSYFSFIDDANGYKIDERWLARVVEVVDMCVDAGLFCVVNMHGDGYTTIRNGWLLCAAEDQGPILEKYGSVWDQVARALGGYGESVIFESMNEEFDGSYAGPNARAYENINAYNELFVRTVRAAGGNNARRWLLVPGWNTNINETVTGFGTEGHFRLPADERLMVSVHYYDPWGFCGGENGTATQWGAFAAKPEQANGTEVSMAKQFNLLRDTFTSRGIPVILGEWGSIDKLKHDADSAVYRAYYARKLCENARRTGVVPIIWDNGWNGDYGFALFDRGKKADESGEIVPGSVRVTQQGIIDAIMGVYGTGSAGTAGYALGGSPGTLAGTAGSVTGDTLAGMAVTSKATIELDRDALEMKPSATAILGALLANDEGPEKITWASSDETVAVVWDGIVKATGAGSCVIDATLANGNAAKVTVTVSLGDGVQAKLYCFEGLGWSSVQSAPFIVSAGVDASYEATLRASSLVLGNIAALYLKDIEVEENHATVSKISSCAITVESLTVNGVKVPLSNNEMVQAVNQKGQFDLPIINEWNAGIEMVKGLPASGHRNLAAAVPELAINEENNLVVVKFRTHAGGALTGSALAGVAGAVPKKPTLEADKTYHAYFGIQTADSWVFRNAWSNSSFGGSTTQFKAGLYDTENALSADGVVSGTITDAEVTKRGIEEGKRFVVSCEGFNFADKATEAKAFNVAMISTDIPYETVKVTDARLIFDGKEANLRGGSPVFASDIDNSYLVVYFINIWNSAIKTFGYNMPKKSVRMELTLELREGD